MNWTLTVRFKDSRRKNRVINLNSRTITHAKWYQHTWLADPKVADVSLKERK